MTRTLGIWTAISLVLLRASVAFADPSAEDRATARSLAGEGYQALQQKAYATAVDRFRRADALVHAPTLIVDWARSLVGLGKLVEAQERYEQILREGVDPKAPRSWQKAFTDAGVELAALKPRLAWVTFAVSGSNEARMTIDGAPVPPAAIGVRRPINPGNRLVRVMAKGYLSQKRTLRLAEGSDSQVNFRLEPDPDWHPQASTMLDARAPVTSPVLHHRSPVPMYVAFGVGGAGLVLGGVAGSLALVKRSSLVKACDSNDGCMGNERGTLTRYHTLGTLSGVGFAVGLAGIGAGAVLWSFNRRAEQPLASGITVHPYIGVTSVGATGTF